jgi:tetratricopeptide (TPR) repeat protein
LCSPPVISDNESVQWRKKSLPQKILIVEFENIAADLRVDVPYDQLVESCKAAKTAALAQGDIRAIGHAAKGLGECYRRVGLLDSAEVEYAASLACFEEARDLSGMAWARWAKANLLRQKSDFAGCFRELTASYAVAVEIKDYHCAAYSLAGHAESTRILGHYSASLSQHSKTLEMFQEELSGHRLGVRRNCTNVQKYAAVAESVNTL